MTGTQELLQEIKDGAKALGIAPTTLCQRAVRHGGLIRRLEKGGQVTLETAEEIRSYITKEIDLKTERGAHPSKVAEGVPS